MVSKQCLQCNHAFKAYPSQIKRGRRFCSKNCSSAGEHNGRYNGGLKVLSRVCLACGQEFNIIERMTRNHPGIYCSRKCVTKSQTTGRSPRYLGGYLYIPIPEHPHANCDGFVAEHRLIMEKHLGRYLTPMEIVHHINYIRNDNRLSNLMLMPSWREHEAIHKQHKSDLMKKIRSEKFWSSGKKVV